MSHLVILVDGAEPESNVVKIHLCQSDRFEAKVD